MKSRRNRSLLIFMLVCTAIVFYSCKDGGGSNPPGSNELNPEITSVEPTSGPEGSAVTITGTDFSPTASNNTVTFNGTVAEVGSANSTQLETTVPAGATSGEVTVSVDGNRASGPSFTVEIDTPEITSVSPDTVYVGDEITIKGSKFSSVPSENELQISGIPVTVTQASDTLLVAEAPNPEGDMDGIDVRVTVAGQTATFSNFFILRFIAVTGGERHSCALTIEGNAYCWGENGAGQLGNNNRTESRIPVAVTMPDGVRFTAISVGRSHSIALDQNGEAWGWGGNAGRLGDGTETNRLSPVMANQPSGVMFTDVSAGGDHTLALDENGQAWAWGVNSFSRLGDGTETDRLSPVTVNMPDGVSFTQISGGMFHSAAIDTDGNAWAWGRNHRGQLGDGSTTDRIAPVSVDMPADVSFTQIASGDVHTVTRSSDGEAWGWGNNAFGQLGNGTTTNSFTPVAANTPSGVSFMNISVGNIHTIVVSQNGQAWGWGSNNVGRLGVPESDEEINPVLVRMPDGVSFFKVATGTRHSLAITDLGKVYAWGQNTSGQLGDGTTENKDEPILITF